jgi:hypothetical protein
VIVGGLVAALILGVYLLPTLYVWVAATATCCRKRKARSCDRRAPAPRRGCLTVLGNRAD